MNTNKNTEDSNVKLKPYPSVTAMKDVHTSLLKRNREGDTNNFYDDVEVFLIRGSLTGALLDSYEDREASQSLLDYWVTILTRTKRTVPDATLAEFDSSLSPILDDSLCPYLGLNAFQEKDKDLFYGRQRLIDNLISEVKEKRFLFVVGPSGSGKSSLVLGGLLPALQNGVITGSEDWQYITRIVPGSNPLKNLATAFNIKESEKQQVEKFKQDRKQLLRLVEEQGNTPAVLIVDQFEEIFTLCNDENIRNAFIENLIALAESTSRRHIVILTLRSDYEPYVASITSLFPYYEEGQTRVTALTASDLREVIEEPARRIGLKFETGIVDALIKDILGEPAGLPLLQFTLLQLWKRRENKRNRITWENYRKLGDARQALSLTAEEFYKSLVPENQIMVQRILLKMAKPSENLQVTSSRVKNSTLQQSIGGDVIYVANLLVDKGLVRLTKGDKEENDQYEVAHEALVRNWERLVEWLDNERLRLRQRIRLTAAAEQWQELGRDEGGLLGGKVLEEALQYNDLNNLEKEFVQASKDAAEAVEREKAEAEQREKELDEARIVALEQKNAEVAKNARRFRAFAAILFLIALSAIGAAGWALTESKRAKSESEKALVQQQLAEERRIEAEGQKKEAEEQRVKAEEKSKEAEEQRVKAEEQTQLAEVQKKKAEEQQLIANEQRKKAEQQSRLAEEKKREAEDNFAKLQETTKERDAYLQTLNNLLKQNERELAEKKQKLEVQERLQTADAQLDAKKANEAIQKYEDLLTNPSVLQDEHMNAVVLSHLAKAYDEISENTDDKNALKSKENYKAAEDIFNRKLPDEKALETSTDTSLISVLERRAEFYLYHDESEEAVEDYLFALGIQERTLSKNDELGFHKYNELVKTLAMLYEEDDFSFGEEDFENLYKRDLETKTKFAETNRAELYNSLNQLAKFYLDTNSNDSPTISAAIDNYKKALDLVREGYPFSNTDLLDSLSNIANAYMVDKKFDSAELFYKEIIDIESKKAETIYSANASFRLGGIYSELNKDINEAENFYQKALKIYKKYPETEQKNIILTLDTLGIFYLNHNKSEKFESIYAELLNSINADLIKIFKPGTLRVKLTESLIKKADDYVKKEDYEQAEKYYDLASALDTKIDERPDFVIASKLGMLYQLQGRLTEAEAKYLLSLELMRPYLGNSSSLRFFINYSVPSQNGLAKIYQGQKKYAEAEKLYQKSLDQLKRLSIKPLLVESLKAYANLLQEVGRKEEADALLLQAGKEEKN